MPCFYLNKISTKNTAEGRPNNPWTEKREAGVPVAVRRWGPTKRSWLVNEKQEQGYAPRSDGRLYWTRTSDLSHVKGTRYQLRQETNRKILENLARGLVKLKRFLALNSARKIASKCRRLLLNRAGYAQIPGGWPCGQGAPLRRRSCGFGQTGIGHSRHSN
jgi:hypothetical protein